MSTDKIINCIANIYKIKINLLLKQKKQIINCTESNKKNILKELYKRIIVPFYIPILMLVPYFLILSSKEKTNYSKLKITTFLIGVFVIIFSEGIIRLVSDELFNNILIFITPLMLFFLLYVFFLLKLSFRN